MSGRGKPPAATANWSPPARPIRSPLRNAERRRCATTRSTPSPMDAPSVSFTVRKPFRSTSSTVTRPPLRIGHQGAQCVQEAAAVGHPGQGVELRRARDRRSGLQADQPECAVASRSGIVRMRTVPGVPARRTGRTTAPAPRAGAHGPASRRSPARPGGRRRAGPPAPPAPAQAAPRRPGDDPCSMRDSDPRPAGGRAQQPRRLGVAQHDAQPGIEHQVTLHRRIQHGPRAHPAPAPARRAPDLPRTGALGSPKRQRTIHAQPPQECRVARRQTGLPCARLPGPDPGAASAWMQDWG